MVTLSQTQALNLASYIIGTAQMLIILHDYFYVDVNFNNVDSSTILSELINEYSYACTQQCEFNELTFFSAENDPT